MTPRDIGLYLHIPFCARKCLYCDFASVAGRQDLWKPYLGVLLEEIAAVPPLRPRTLYIGGGTPSLWPADYLVRLIAAVGEVGLPADAEVTVEANPGTVSLGRLLALRHGGCNRISLGVQSTAERYLRMLGRIHTYAQAEEAVRWARRAGFDNLSVDMIYGLPGQTLEDWRDDLERAVELGSEHLSAYCLSLEEGTSLAASVDRGDLPDPDPDLAADMYLATEEILAKAGYRHYEISNWAREPNPPAAGAALLPIAPFPAKEGGAGTDLAPPGANRKREPGLPSPIAMGEGLGVRASLTAKHNLIYWLNQPYLGLGVGAHSHLGNRRFARLGNPAAYVSATPADRVVFSEVISGPLEMAETAILGLRLVSGLERARFGARFGVDALAVYREPLLWAEAEGLVELDAGWVRLTGRGRLLSNEVFQRLLPD